LTFNEARAPMVPFRTGRCIEHRAEILVPADTG
jgi:hypothetical protein